MQINGEIKVINDTQIVSEKFSKREFVLTIEPNSQYPQHVIMEFTQDKCDLLDKYAIGQEVSVDFNLCGREWNGPQGIRYFNTLRAWKIEAVNAAPKQQPHQVTVGEVNNIVNNNSGSEDDLPF